MGLYLQVNTLLVIYKSRYYSFYRSERSNSEPVDYKLKMFGIGTAFGIQSSDLGPRLYLQVR